MWRYPVLPLTALYIWLQFIVSSILYLLNLYITKMAKPISTTETSMMTAVPLWPLSLLSTRGALKEKEWKRKLVHIQAEWEQKQHLMLYEYKVDSIPTTKQWRITTVLFCWQYLLMSNQHYIFLHGLVYFIKIIHSPPLINTALWVHVLKRG